MAARPRFTSTAQAMRASASLRRAITAAGGAARLALRLDVQITAIPRWTFCPGQHVVALSAASGVSVHDLRPDLYPRPRAARELTADEVTAAHLAAGAHFARTGRCLSAEVAR
jgi:DNA-binding transcriptional regulator YdaS (Cro superfamily)